MAIQSKKESVEVPVGADAPVWLTVTIGNAQIGGNLLKEKDKDEVLAKGEITNLDLGTGSALKGRTLNMITNILDVNEQTNGVVVTYFFQGGQPAVFTFHDRVKDDGDIFSFLVEFKFK